MRVLYNILLGCRKTCAVLQLNDTVCLQKEKRSGLIGGIVRNRNLCAVLNIFQILGLSCIDSERLIVNLSYRNNMGVVFLIEIIQIRLMLEIVCINLSFIRSNIRLNVIIIGYDFNLHALLL